MSTFTPQLCQDKPTVTFPAAEHCHCSLDQRRVDSVLKVIQEISGTAGYFIIFIDIIDIIENLRVVK